MKIPATLLSLIYHSTVPRYRDEMHSSLDRTFRRFAIDDVNLQKLNQKAIPTAKQIRDAAGDVDHAAFEVRSGTAGGKLKLTKASTDLFGYLAYVLAAEISKGMNVPDQPGTGSNGIDAGFLTQLYLLVYSSVYRDANDASRALPGASNNVKQSWDAVRDALMNGGAAFNDLLPYTQVLCEKLAADFSSTLWPIPW